MRNNGRLPNFLLIGAMKAGTTSLCAALERHPDIFIPSVKEPHFLCMSDITSPSGIKQYKHLFKNAQPAQICGEASTGYSKLPTIKSIPARASAMLGSDIKIIYIVRDPIQRALSHHYHLLRSRKAPANFEDAMRSTPELIHYGQYAMQLRAWMDFFPKKQILMIKFEDFLADHTTTIHSVFEHVGADVPAYSSHRAPSRNRGEDTAVFANPLFRRIKSVTQKRWYKTYCHSRLPSSIRSIAKSLLMRPADPRPAPPSEQAVGYMAEQLLADSEELKSMFGISYRDTLVATLDMRERTAATVRQETAAGKDAR